MSTRTYTNVTARVEEAPAGNIQPLGWLPNDIQWPASAGAADVFSNIQGIPPLGFKSGGAAQAEVSFRPVDDGAIPSNATIENVEYRLRLMWAKQNIAHPGVNQDASPFMVHEDSLTLSPESATYVSIPPDLDVTETPESFTILPSSVASPPDWVVRWTGFGDKSPFNTRFGVHYSGDPEAGPLVVFNADVTIEFTLPAPDVVSAPASWTLGSRDGDTIGFIYNGMTLNAPIVTGTYTSGATLAAAILTGLDSTIALDWFCTYAEDSRQFTVGFVPGEFDAKTITFDFGTVASVGPKIGFRTQQYTGAASYTSGTNFPAQHPVENVTRVRALVHGTVNPNGATLAYPVEVYAEYWPTDGSESRQSTDSVFLTGSSEQGVAFVLTSLQPGTEYTCRLVAGNEDNTVYGAEETFTTPEEDGAIRG